MFDNKSNEMKTHIMSCILRTIIYKEYDKTNGKKKTRDFRIAADIIEYFRNSNLC